MVARRVLVIGSGGAGKSTLAARIGARAGLPVVHLDALYWRAGWVPTPDDEWREVVRRLVRRDAWVMDGNYGGTLDVRLEACDAVVFLDLPRWRCVARILGRWRRYAGRTRPDMAPGCPERMSWEFIAWVWSYPRLRRPGVLARLAASARPTVILRSPREVDAFVATFDATFDAPFDATHDAAPRAASPA